MSESDYNLIPNSQMASIDHTHNLAAARAPPMAAAPTPPQGSNAAPNSQTPGHPSFRRCVAICSPVPDPFPALYTSLAISI